MPEAPKILTRIYIKPDGDLIVTDMWDEVPKLLKPYFTGPTEVDEQVVKSEIGHEASEDI